MSDFQTKARTSKGAFECFLFHSDISLVSRRGWAHQLHAGQTAVSMLLMSLERKGMQLSRLIETKSTPCLCEVPFSWLKTLTVGNYSAGERQSLNLMCNHRSEPDIKGSRAISGSCKHPCINNCRDPCVPPITHSCPCCFLWLRCKAKLTHKGHGEQIQKVLRVVRNIHRITFLFILSVRESCSRRYASPHQ